MSEENKAIVQRFLDELHNMGNVAIVDEFVDASYVNHWPDGQDVTRDDLKAGGTRAAFPDLKLTIDDQVAEGDKIVTRWTMIGTHRGQWRGIAPTNRELTTTGIFIHRIADGKLAEAWTHSNLFEQLSASS